MNDFPDFMKNSANKVDSKSQYTPGIEGYVYDGVDGSQMAFWIYKQTAKSKEHFHEYEEYIAVIQGQYTIFIENERIPLHPGDEYLIPKGVFGYASRKSRMLLSEPLAPAFTSTGIGTPSTSMT